LELVDKQRRLRLQAVGTGLPASLWSVVLIGAFLNIALTYLFWVENRPLHALLVGILATFVGLLIFLTAAMDNPFRGEFSVSPDVFQEIFDNVMKPAGSTSGLRLNPAPVCSTSLEPFQGPICLDRSCVWLYSPV